MTCQPARRLAAAFLVALAALAAAGCATLAPSSAGQTQHVESTPISRTHFWGSWSEAPDAPPSNA